MGKVLITIVTVVRGEHQVDVVTVERHLFTTKVRNLLFGRIHNGLIYHLRQSLIRYFLGTGADLIFQDKMNEVNLSDIDLPFIFERTDSRFIIQWQVPFSKQYEAIANITEQVTIWNNQPHAVSLKHYFA